MTYPQPIVVSTLMSRFVPLELDLFRHPQEVVRPLNVIWTPTMLFVDQSGTVHYRNINYLPPGLFLTLLDLGEASVDLRWSRIDHAIVLLQGAYQRDPAGAWHQRCSTGWESPST